MSAKKRKYLEEYIRFGFVSFHKGDTEVPQCVICFKTLSNDGMLPSRLERHLKTTHPALADKPRAFFETKRHSLKQAKLDGSGAFQQQTSKVVEASYEIALLIAKSKKSHNIGESLIKPSLLCAAELVLGKIVQTSSPKFLCQTIQSREGSMKCLKTSKSKFSIK
ncbi:zinc finger BED domain-containing protein 5-like [Macrobrachium rosenbergii]|uniref:zinc finger BED domain-containing protein 5-like n=1 Tax=Macrobrachium rosenbergii TaxID=79674 RepID=UPI0034D527B3